MPRDEFPRDVVEALAKRVACRCSNPDCSRITSGPNSNPAKWTNLGVAAHITAAAVGGPRYDSTLGSDARKSAENGIWLCQRCAKLIDSDVDKYPTPLLKSWKARRSSSAAAGS